MLSRLLPFGRSRNQTIADRIYEQIVASARQPVFFSDWGVPDTPLGRYEALSLHMFLFLHRARGAAGPLERLAQHVTDEFFRDVDHSLRELGIGDLGVPKRIKKLARMFYGRARSYGEALDDDDRPALAAALARNVRPEAQDWPGAAALADYAFIARDALAAQDEAALLGGSIRYPDAAEAER